VTVSRSIVKVAFEGSGAETGDVPLDAAVPVGAHATTTTRAKTRTFRCALAMRSTFLGSDSALILVFLSIDH
jgi:hypothetical protein